MTDHYFRKGGAVDFKYPLTEEFINSLQNSTCVSLRSPEDPDVFIYPGVEDALIEPPKPGTLEFELNLMAVVAYRNAGSIALHDKITPPIAEILQQLWNDGVGYETHEDWYAEVVHSDGPTEILNRLTEWLIADGAKFREGLLFKKGMTEFTDGQVLVSKVLAECVYRTSTNAFAHKWFWGQMRPEEAIQRWAVGELKVSPITDTFLNDFIDRAAVIKDMRSFTAYPEGSPEHPDDPAMHAAAGGAAVLLPTVFDLNDDQLEVVRNTMYLVAFFRSLAGVHPPNANLNGLELGEMCVEKLLPVILEEAVGANKDTVAALTAKYRNHWTTRRTCDILQG